MTNTDFVRRYMGYVSENSTAARYNTRWESTVNTTYGSGTWVARGSGGSNLEEMYRLLTEYDRHCKDTALTGKSTPKSEKLPESYPNGDINSLLGLSVLIDIQDMLRRLGLDDLKAKSEDLDLLLT